MAPRVVGLAAAVLGVAAVTFVAPSTSGARRLRTPVAQPAAASFGTSAESNSLYGICSAVGGVALLAAGAAVIRRAESKELTIEAIPRPEDLLDSPKFPMFEGGTGGYMSRSTRERHANTFLQFLCLLIQGFLCLHPATKSVLVCQERNMLNHLKDPRGIKCLLGQLSCCQSK